MADFKNYDYFSENKDDFYCKFSHKSILCQGKHWKKPPLVTILIPTYKRPDLLSQALESALNQKGFDDYQIIIADNEGRPIEEETPTAKIVKKYQEEKIIYYRHSQEVMFRADSAVRLARSQWIVFLHDDDVLAENHLAVMTNIVKKHKEIKFLGCPMKDFTSEWNFGNEKKPIYSYTVSRYLKNMTCLGEWSGWLGALISRKHYIAIGGMPVIAAMVGDMMMAAKFLHRFGAYGCISNRPLYYYRRGKQQMTYAFKNKLETNRIEEYYFYKYAINKYHRVTHKIWERNIAYVILEECKWYSSSNIYQANIDIDYIISECGMPADIKKKNIRYYATKHIFSIYKKCIKYLDDIYVGKLQKSDIHITI